MKPSNVPGQGPDFSSDVGRKKFGFSHEEIDDSSAYYEGQFKLFQRSGDGTLHSPETGSKYVGQFHADHFHGSGDQIWSDGSTYVGQWIHGQKAGAGVYVSVDNLKYDGQWEDGRRHGQGSQEYCNGDRYKGWWFHGLCSGTGVYHFSDGSRYEGTWANGRYDGPGMLYGCGGHKERQWHNSGLLMKTEVLPMGNGPKSKDRVSNKVLLQQTRVDMHKPTVLQSPQPSKYLIHRETAGMDLSASPLRAKTALPQLGRTGESLFTGSDDTTLRPSSAGGELDPATPPMLKGASGSNANRLDELELRPELYSP